MLLYLAGRESRLVWESEDAFAVVEPPIARAQEWSEGPNAFRWLALVVRWWDLAILGVPPALIMAAAVPVALTPWRKVALVMLLSAVAYVAIQMSVGVLRLTWLLIRRFNYHRRTGRDFLTDELSSYHWVITLLHSPHPEAVEDVVKQTVKRAAALDGQLTADAAYGTTLLACSTRCVTTAASREALNAAPQLIAVGESDWRVTRTARKVRRPNTSAIEPISAVRLMILTAVVGVGVQAQFIADVERQSCEDATCPSRPVTFLQAAEWLLHRLSWQSSSFEPVTWQSRALGLVTMALGPVLLACVIIGLRRHLRYQDERKKMMYAHLDAERTARSTVLLFVVNETERDAVIAAVCEQTGCTDPRPDQVDLHTVFRLGTLGSNDIVLAHSEQGTVSSHGMTTTAGALLQHLSPNVVILTGVCYGLKSRRYDGGEQELGDLIVSTQLRAVDHRKVTVVDGERHEINRGPRPEPAIPLLSRARAATYGWTGPAVHFGPVLSLNTLLNDPEERARLQRQDEEAIGGEMELAGLYAAAARTKTDWLLVKGISDWGRDKTSAPQAPAARNAADFVVRLLRLGSAESDRHEGS
ncbi:hypothetical protein [Micromonospora sp. WMMD964]|uniref:5'-methylthioadenosine/S-adenosylhomocysteine nucleosidase family protein n=1 Tax=Micromonospora sp. WMMD964 TaxID=3016091 RepID=UPI00249A2397|nr:hypothetical protein [Micromonospora sp. WMMD964]WFE99596.1 hypothetical protein O7616_22235 [Micromonospora sp. WMMD964]